MARKPHVEVELDDELEDDTTEYQYAKTMNDISEILSTAYQEVEAKVRTLVDELGAKE